jgi:hypothetical protein
MENTLISPGQKKIIWNTFYAQAERIANLTKGKARIALIRWLGRIDSIAIWAILNTESSVGSPIDI